MTVTDQPSTLDLVLHEVALAVLPLRAAATLPPVPSGLTALLEDSGVDVSTLGVTPQELVAISADVASAVGAIDALTDSATTSGAVELGRAVEDLVSQLRRINAAPSPGDVGTAAERLLGYLLADYLRRSHRGLYAFLSLAGLMVEPHSGVVGTPPRLGLDRLARLVTEPNALLAEAYGWGGESVDFPLLLDHLQQVALSLGYPAIPRLPGEELMGTLGIDQAQLPSPALRVALAALAREGGVAEMGLEVVPGHVPGHPDHLAVVPYGGGSVTETLPLGDHWNLRVAAEGDAGVPYGLILSPGNITFSAVDGVARQLVLAVQVAIARDQPAGASRTLLGSPTGSRLDVGTLSLTLRASANPPDIGVEVAGSDWRIVAKAEPGDGFLAAILPAEGLQVPFSAGVGWSSAKGLYFTGAAGLRVDLPVNKDLGPVHVTTVSVAASAGADVGSPGPTRVELSAAVSGRLSLGPFVVTVREVGVTARLQPGAQPANVAIGRLDAGFKPPTGAGIAITNPALSGGGFLSYDEQTGTYAGIVQLSLLKTVTVSGIGIVTTRLPDGRPGFALLILITAQGFTPVQLGMGFALTGIGGLIALNRTVDADAVRNGLSDGILDSVLFVKDPVKNADRVIATLDKVFPIARDRLVVGPLAEISWGTPPILKMRLALLLDLPMPIRAVILAALSLTLPKPEAAVVEIHVDAIGVIDIGKGQIALDASLHDSRILSFTLTGDLALRLDWGSNPGFLLSVGGFHPRFRPPPGLRPLKRLALQLTSGNNPMVRFEAYLAVTSNTLQMGARATVKLAIAGFGIEGGGSFDTLIQWSPFHLEVDLAAWVKITAGGTTILALNLQLAITGPAPWHLTGKAEFHILFFSVSVAVDLTLGASSTATAAVETVDVAGLIWQQVSDPLAWQAVLPASASPGAVVAAGPVDPSRVLAHPLATVSVRQKVAPLGPRVTHVGAHLPTGGASTYGLTLTTPDGAVASPLTDLFAPAQFVDMPAEQRLTAPSFETFASGVELRPAAAESHGPSTTCLAVVDTLEVTALDSPPTPGAPAAAVSSSARTPS